MKHRPPKRITQQQITGQQGVAFVERVVLEMGFTWHPTNAGLEGGIDGFIEIRDPETGDLTNNIIQVQVKATERLWISETRDEFTYLCNDRDIDYWMRANTPVALVAVRPKGDEAYWVNVRQLFSDPKRRLDRHIRFDKKTQRFEASAASALMRLAVPKDVGPYLPATYHSEKLISNLLEVTSFPASIYVACTEYRRPEEVFSWAKERGVRLPSGWVLTDKTIHSVHDLWEEPWVELVDKGTVDRFEVEEWVQTDDPDRQREFVRLMNQVLREDMRVHRLWHSKDEKCFFFPTRRGEDGRPASRTYRYRSLQHQASSEVVKIEVHRKTGEIYYCRHDAFKHLFLRVGGNWHLAITPHYVFTTDGRMPHPSGEDLLSGLKRQEHQQALLGQVVMWQYKLTHIRPKELFDTDDEQQPLLAFGDLLRAECDRGVDDQDWLGTETAQADTDDDDDWDAGGLF
ncbi:MAG TPA: DUF4365 domain-containing protein [Phycisphaerae bacterium]|nr:DUF4365 domain-containing protein [Phycisphaerae bacterium]